jgi:hypothetical protein
MSFDDILGDEFGGGVLPVVECSLRHSGLEPVQGNARLWLKSIRVPLAAVGLETYHVGEVQRVVMPPLIGGAEVALAAWLELQDTLGQQGFEFGGAFQGIAVCAALGEAVLDDGELCERAGGEARQVT